MQWYMYMCIGIGMFVAFAVLMIFRYWWRQHRRKVNCTSNVLQVAGVQAANGRYPRTIHHNPPRTAIMATAAQAHYRNQPPGQWQQQHSMITHGALPHYSAPYAMAPAHYGGFGFPPTEAPPPYTANTMYPSAGHQQANIMYPPGGQQPAGALLPAYHASSHPPPNTWSAGPVGNPNAAGSSQGINTMHPNAPNQPACTPESRSEGAFPSAPSPRASLGQAASYPQQSSERLTNSQPNEDALYGSLSNTRAVEIKPYSPSEADRI